jgi:hypothetical protein
MTGGDEPESTSNTAPVATTSATGSQQHAPICPTPNTEGDPESGFSHEWISNHEENAARRQREIREASNGQHRVPEYRTFQQQQGQQQQMEMDEEERKYDHRCYDSLITVYRSRHIYRSRHHLQNPSARIEVNEERLEMYSFYNQ